MARNHIKLLTQSELERFNNKYQICVDGDDIVVSLSNYDRYTRHPKDKGFFINSRIEVKRKINFTVEAIQIWIKCIEDNYNYSLFDVQQAVNALTITYQTINYESVLKYLKNPIIKI